MPPPLTPLPSLSANADAPPPDSLFVSPNWLGDLLMALPALQAWRNRHPDRSLAILTRPALLPLWRLSPVPALLIPHAKTDPWQPLIRNLRLHRFQTAYILPRSIRSAIAPCWAGIPRRLGLPGHFFRDLLLTETRPLRLPPDTPPDALHQAFEALALLLPDDTPLPATPDRLPPPHLTLSSSLRQRLTLKLAALPRPWITLIPGAARGPSKQWPAAHYARTAQSLTQKTAGTILLTGTAAESPLCEEIAAACPPERARNLAGDTTLEEMAAVLALSDAVLCNDSGGMHLAAALGTPVVACFGITNPQQTGPLGAAPIRILQHSAIRRRDLPRSCPEAETALRSISPEEALEALLPLLPQ